jgi:hypothetical protein
MQRIRHVYRRQQPAPLPRRTAQSRHQLQLEVDGLDVAHARSLWPYVASRTSALGTSELPFHRVGGWVRARVRRAAEPVLPRCLALGGHEAAAEGVYRRRRHLPAWSLLRTRSWRAATPGSFQSGWAVLALGPVKPRKVRSAQGCHFHARGSLVALGSRGTRRSFLSSARFASHIRDRGRNHGRPPVRRGPSASNDGTNPTIRPPDRNR